MANIPSNTEADRQNQKSSVGKSHHFLDMLKHPQVRFVSHMTKSKLEAFIVKEPLSVDYP